MLSASALVLAASVSAEARADSFDVAGMPLIFSGSGTGSGTTVGSYRDYTNVITIGGKRIDARVTLTALSGATVTSFDSTANPYAEGSFFQPNLNITSVGGYATFRVDFFDENGQPATLMNFYANTYDLDGAGGSASGRQFTDFSGFASYALSDGTKVVTQNIGGRTRFLTTVGGNLTYATGTDDFNTIRARVYYTSVSSVSITLGDAGATGAAYYGLDFSLGYAFNNVVADSTPPVVTAAQSFSYVENQAPNAAVATVAATDAIGVTAFRFGATNTQTSADGYYTIDSSGLVRLTAAGAAAGVAQNDYDVAPNSFTYAIQAGDAAGNWSPATNVTFNVTAAAPKITGPSGGAGAVASAVSVNENQTAVTTLTADRAVTWAISGGVDAAKFMIDAAGVIIFATAPDFEAPTDADTNNVYVLEVTATDGGGQAAVQTVSVTVLDLADNAPVITGPSGGAGAANSALAVNENQTAVTTVTSSTPATWAISGGADAARFTIDPATGVLTFNAAPDFEAPTDTDTNNVYVVEVKATDASSLTAVQTVSVTVLDVVEGPPVITGPSGGAGAVNSALSVNEAQTAVTTLIANRPVTWSITGGADAARFAIDANGVITFVAAPDYEAPSDADTNNIYLLEVTVTDAGNQTAVQTIAVTVLDIVDGAPVITGPSGGAGAGNSAVTVTEGETAVTTVTANRPVTWAITGGPDAAKFAVSAGGAITFVAAPDYEAPTDADGNNIYVLELTATDASNMIAMQTVTVTVRDLDDTAPVIKDPKGASGSASTTITVNEGATAVGAFTADEATTWSITEGADKDKFKIDPATGLVTFIAAPDFESPGDADGNNVYEVKISATDGAGNVGRLTVGVQVLDVDDTGPVITGPNGVAGAAGSTLSLQEGLTAVTTFVASEAVTWSLAGGTEQALFAIDPKTGALTYVTAPNFEAPTDSDKNNSYLVVVRATDASGNHTDHVLTVQITDVDEVTPRIDAIAKELRSDLRNHAFRGLGDMLAFNEGLFRDTGDCIAMPRQGVFTPSMNINEFNQSSSLDWAKTHCTDRYRIIANAGVAIDHADGDWTHRGLASVRVERELKKGLTLGVGLMGSFANNDLPSFTESSIKDHSLQLNGYLRANLTERLRAGAFAGFGRAWYDFDLHQPGFDLSGRMTGNRQLYGAMLSGDIAIAKVLVTTDVILSRATEDLGQAKLTGTAGGETRDVLFAVGGVDMTRLSVPVSGEFKLWEQTSQGWNTTLRLSPGLLCEDTSADTRSLTCGYQFGGRLIARNSKSGSAYVDYRMESVDNQKRSLIGIGYGASFGPRRQMEWAFDVSGGVAADQPDSRAMFHLRARQ
jgi:hypothetical protein